MVIGTAGIQFSPRSPLPLPRALAPAVLRKAKFSAVVVRQLAAKCLRAATLATTVILGAGGLAGAAPVAPGDAYRPEGVGEGGAGAPLVFEHSAEAGPDETFLIVGERLTGAVAAWGRSADNAVGQAWQPRVQFLKDGYLAATLPERAPDGPFVVWVKSAAGAGTAAEWSAPFVLNAPQPWWCGPGVARPGEAVRVFGRNLARRPDGAQAFVYVAAHGRDGVWAEVLQAGKYAVTFRVPPGLAAGDYEVSMHAGAGGVYGWGGPVPLRIEAATPAAQECLLPAGASGAEMQRALDQASGGGGVAVVKLPAGTFTFTGTLRIPAGVALVGAGRDRTALQIVRDPGAHFARLGGAGWNQAPGAIHTPGDTLEYEIAVPQEGDWTVWLRYGTDMSPWKQPGVSRCATLAADGGGAPVPLDNLPNTGGFGVFKWSKSAVIHLAAGKRTMVWKNVKGGGISLDAFVFALNPAFAPSDTPLPQTGDGVIVLQGEDVARFASKDGTLPADDRAAVWLAGDGAGVADLTILGNPQVNLGVVLQPVQSRDWISGCRVERVRVADNDGKQAENCGLVARRARGAVVRDNELAGRTPLFLAGVRQCDFSRNRLVSQTRFGGNAEAAILGRTDIVEQCIIEGNVVAAPAGAEAGGPTARRLIWLSTGRGSVAHNYLAGNGVEAARGPGAAEAGAGAARFGGVAGTDQNVGETILLEGNHRTAYFGPLADGDAQGVTLPATIPATPEARLGSVKRTQLAHDAAGNETPYWPPDADDGGDEPALGEYYVTIFSGRGQGQTRRVVQRAGTRLVLDRPWRVAPERGSVVAVGTAFYQNIITGNHTPDGMTGIQLWISCIENVIAANTIARQRRPGLFLYGNGTTLASSMPRTWNRGISPLFWNLCEGNRAEECSVGALVTSGDSADLPVEFPRALGNVLRHNSFVRLRTDGVELTSRKAAAGVQDSAAAIAGTIVEFNVVRDAAVGYHAGETTDAVVFRRNHAYFWSAPGKAAAPPVAFQADNAHAAVVVEQNSIEGMYGDPDAAVTDFKSPAGARALPQ